MFGSFSDPKPRHAQPCTVPEALLSAVCLCHHRQCMCVRVCTCVFLPTAEQDPIWFAPVACEARLWGSTSLYSPNGFPLPAAPPQPSPDTSYVHSGKYTYIQHLRGGRGGQHRADEGASDKLQGFRGQLVDPLKNDADGPLERDLGTGVYVIGDIRSL